MEEKQLSGGGTFVNTVDTTISRCCTSILKSGDVVLLPVLGTFLSLIMIKMLLFSS